MCEGCNYHEKFFYCACEGRELGAWEYLTKLRYPCENRSPNLETRKATIEAQQKEIDELKARLDKAKL